ncbi:hypothetical protein FPV67DRAFT_1469501 [Lyophyllum atratum]|nr:hypothetical protein FPV67DRAFT_1469501 [Lyophyllum atratum]
MPPSASEASIPYRFSRALALSTFLLLVASTLLLSQAGISRAIDELIVLYPGRYADQTVKAPSLENKFSWNLIDPSENLVWHSCYSTHQCARLIVPLNYSDADGDKATIAMTRIPSKLGPDSSAYRGPILINPGGPGGSGVDVVLRAGALLSGIIGPQFDILGFDPRGVGRSTPRVSFFETDVERELWGGSSGMQDLSVLNASADGLARAWAPRDMLSIVKAHGKEKLLYWGFSYGSVLGATFASMFPDKIERLVIDGVVDIKNYYSTLWSTNLLDTDKTMDAFFTYCHSAGPSGCPFYAPSPDLIAANLTALYNSVSARPIPVRTANSYGIVDYSRLRTSVFVSLYSPWASWPPLAQALADLANGDGATLFSLLEKPPFECECGKRQGELPVVRDAETAIVCNDGDVVPEAFEELEKYFKDTTSKSQWAEIWGAIRTACLIPNGSGPFEANTSFPLLVVGNTAGAAKKTAKGFPNAVVLTQDSPGHCSISAPSLCTQTYIRDYFVKGTLPPPGTICSTTSSPFPDVPPDLKGSEQGVLGQKQVGQQAELLSAEQRVVLDAVRKLSESYALPRML